ncbi:MAG TPA: hypothetical protein VD999_03865 [Vitreimonas sp.]|nr:hypothetical protein [Vitreimonas sp.]
MSKALIQKSEQTYAFLLKLYPRSFRQEYEQEMMFVFCESLKDSYQQRREQGVINLWARTSVDILKSLVIQHIQSKKGNPVMKNQSLMRVALGTAALLMIPLLGQWPWTVSDFVIMGVLLSATGLMLEFVSSKVKNTNQRIAIALAIVFVFLLIWVELAVGLFGSPFAGN